MKSQSKVQFRIINYFNIVLVNWNKKAKFNNSPLKIKYNFKNNIFVT